MGQLAERVPVVQRKPLVERRAPIAEAQPSRSTARANGFAEARVKSPVSEIVGGLPARLRAGVESLSGIAMDDVRVHRNSSEPAKLGALAFAHGTHIHLGPGQEQHLPHEAWHVVQQKQGRVRATTQLRGSAINDDHGLEREANAISSTKLNMAVNRPARDLRRLNPAGRQVTQAKMVQWDGAPLSYNPAFSLVTNYLISLPEKFMLRKDANPKQYQIHVLNMAKKYLVGEAHNASDFDDQAKLWPGVTLMTEGYKRIPHEAEDKAGVFDPPRRWDQQPIDSSHAYLLVSLLELLNHIEDVLQDIDRDKGDDRSPSNWFGHIRDVERSLDDVRVMYAEYYAPFLNTYEKKFEPALRDPTTKKTSLPPPRIGMIRALSSKLRNAYTRSGGELRKLAASVKAIHDVMDSPRIPRKGWSKPVGDELKKLVPFVSSLAQDLVPIISTSARETGILGGLIPPQPNLASRDTEYVVLTVRNRTMIESVRNEPAPVLVRLGDAHVDPVAAGIGSDAVAIHIPKTLSDITLARPV